MQVVVVGLGVQGKKRQLYCGEEFYASIDPIEQQADYIDLTEELNPIAMKNKMRPFLYEKEYKRSHSAVFQGWRCNVWKLIWKICISHLQTKQGYKWLFWA